MEEARGQKQQTKVSQRKLNQVKVGPMPVLVNALRRGSYRFSK